MAGAKQVVHNSSLSRFEVETESGLAKLEYRRLSSALDLHHTEVPESSEGQGYGSALAEAALEHARATGVRVIPTCPFVRAFVDRRPEFQDLVAARP